MSFLSDFFSNKTSTQFLNPIAPNIQTGSGAAASAGFGPQGQGIANVLFPQSIAGTRNQALAGTQALLGRLSQNAGPFVQARVNPLERALAENQARTQTSFARRNLSGPLLDRTLSGQNLEGQTRIGEQRAIAEADNLNISRQLLQDISGFSRDELDQVLQELGVGESALRLLAGSRGTASGQSSTPSTGSLIGNALLGLNDLLGGGGSLASGASNLLGLNGAGGAIPGGAGLFDSAGGAISGATGLASGAGILDAIAGGSPSFLGGIGSGGVGASGASGIAFPGGETFVNNTLTGGPSLLGSGAIRGGAIPTDLVGLPGTINDLGLSTLTGPGGQFGALGGGGLTGGAGAPAGVFPGSEAFIANNAGTGVLTSPPPGGSSLFSGGGLSNPFTSPAGFFNPSGTAFLGGGGLPSAVPGVGLVMFLASLSNSRSGSEAAEHANLRFQNLASLDDEMQQRDIIDILNNAQKAQRLGFGELVNPEILSVLNSDLSTRTGRSTEGSDFNLAQNVIVENGKVRRLTPGEIARREARDARR